MLKIVFQVNIGEKKKMVPNFLNINRIELMTWYFLNSLKRQKVKIKIDGIYFIEFMNKFLGCVSEYYTNFKHYSVVPN